MAPSNRATVAAALMLGCSPLSSPTRSRPRPPAAMRLGIASEPRLKVSWFSRRLAHRKADPDPPSVAACSTASNVRRSPRPQPDNARSDDGQFAGSGSADLTSLYSPLREDSRPGRWAPPSARWTRDREMGFSSRVVEVLMLTSFLPDSSRKLSCSPSALSDLNDTGCARYA